MAATRKRILFVSECVTLAQVVRLKELASALEPERFDVVFASASFDPMVFGGTRFAHEAIASISPRRLYRRVAAGMRLYDTRTLQRYVREELALIERVAPDLVVGDLRLSLSVSAPKLGVPYAALINAYWNPEGGAASFPMPEHPLVNLIGVERVAPHFHKGLPRVLEHFAAPVNALRRRYGLSPIGSLLEVLTHGDHVLYPDVPELTPVRPLPAHHHFLGPLLWAPRSPASELLGRLDDAKPCVYVTLGSSGGLGAVRAVVEGLARLPVQVLLATAGRFDVGRMPENFFAADYLPGDRAARRAQLVVSNGGSSTGYQALVEGTPVLGLPFNLDQYLAMGAIERAGAGRALRSGTVTPAALRDAASALLEDEDARRAARRAGEALRRLDARASFRAFLEAVFGAREFSLDGGAAKPMSPVCQPNAPP